MEAAGSFKANQHAGKKNTVHVLVLVPHTSLCGVTFNN
jgi:hypothetical protein